MFAQQLVACMGLVGHFELAHVLAYLDPGTGSILLQALLGIMFGGLFCVKLFWTRIQSVSTKLLHRSNQGDQQDK